MNKAVNGIPQKVLFVDRDGTLVEEPADEQVDAIEKVRLVPGVIPAMLSLRDAGFRFVLVSNQDGRGTERFPETDFQQAHQFILALFHSQGIEFDDELICPHFPEDKCACRKPGTAMVDAFLRDVLIDRDHSFVIGDRDSDIELAENLGLKGFRIATNGGAGARWDDVAAQILTQPRVTSVLRKTNETDIRVSVNLDKAEAADVNTGIGFFDHMLEQVAKHGGFTLALDCTGDLDVDEHHTVEDCGLALGQALDQALGDRRGIGRYGFVVPMDESEARVSIDLGGRPYLVFEGRFNRESVGGLATELVPHFFRSLSEGLRAAIHVHVTGANAHHMIESVFKAVGRSLRQAIRREGTELPTTKGLL